MTWTGRGGLVFGIGVLLPLPLFLWGAISNAYLREQVWPWVAVGLLGALLCHVIGRRLNRGLPPRFIDYIRENDHAYAEGHTFFYVRVEWGGVFTMPMALFPYAIFVGPA